MTNTRITDPEVLENRHPVRLLAFGLRAGSGGGGRWPGGDGVVRRFRFLRELDVALLTSRRSTQPFGLGAGAPGAAGHNRRVHADGRVEELPGCATYHAAAGEELAIETPGGGGQG